MLPSESRKYLWDALQAAERIVRFTSEATYDAYRDNEVLRSAVERQFEILGEALGQLSRRDRETAARIPDLNRIVAFRNVLAHGYDTVDDEVVWGLLESRLPELRATLQRLLEQG